MRLFVGELAPAGASTRLFIRVRQNDKWLALIEHITPNILGNKLSPLQAELFSTTLNELQ